MTVRLIGYMLGKIQLPVFRLPCYDCSKAMLHDLLLIIVAPFEYNIRCNFSPHIYYVISLLWNLACSMLFSRKLYT